MISRVDSGPGGEMNAPLPLSRDTAPRFRLRLELALA